MAAIVKVVIGVLWLDSPRPGFLVALREDDQPYPGHWEFPGGKVEPGESDAQALAREWREELGVAITLVSPTPFLRAVLQSNGQPLEAAAYAVRLLTPHTIRPGVAHSEIRLVARDEIAALTPAVPSMSQLAQMLAILPPETFGVFQENKVIEVENSLNIYEVNDEPQAGLDRPKVKVRSSGRQGLVVFVVGDQKLLLSAADLRAAIDNATNAARF